MEQQKGGFRLGYRGDIEGLRAIAILLVVAAHAKVTWLQGGFVGVDVFYILSGYLITGLLVQEAATTGRMRFANFYVRRLRRLLPALFMMLAVTCLIAKVVMPPTELPSQASNAGSAALWLSNFQFAFWNMDYFAPSANTALFLHTWSLGVEEQFYLVWPLLIVLVLGAWKGVKPAARLARLKWLFVGIFLISFILSLYWTSRSPLFGFYLMPSRAWQFALGGVVFLAVGSPAFQVSAAFANAVWLRPAGWLGLGMIVLAGLLIPPTAPYPGSWALLPSFGAALVLAAGVQQRSLLAGILSLRPMQALGRVSYSWYLWHWPVLVLGATLVDMSSGWNRLLLVLLSLLIAVASYHFFETPIRHNRRLVTKPRLAAAGALAIMVVAKLALHAWQVDASEFAQTTTFAQFTAAQADRPIAYYSTGCHSARGSKVQLCTFGNAHATHTAVLIGDSKAAQWVPAYRQVIDQLGWRLLVTTKSGCPLVQASYADPATRHEFVDCDRWRTKALHEIAQLHPDVVIISETYTYPFSKNQWIAGTRWTLDQLAKSVSRIELMRPTPELPVNGPLCLEPRGAIYRALVSHGHCTGIWHEARFADVSNWLKVAASPFRNVHFLDMTNSVCPNGVCQARIGRTIVFSDNGHMTETYVRTLAPALARAFQQNLLQEPAKTASTDGE